jgi:hypothetical protein
MSRGILLRVVMKLDLNRLVVLTDIKDYYKCVWLGSLARIRKQKYEQLQRELLQHNHKDQPELGE